MGDIRDWGKFIRGRWNWTSGGYESGFPRRCQFTDVDASIEFDGRFLLIETKHHDGVILGMDWPDDGQLAALRAEAALGKSVFVVYGCGPCNSPQGLRILGATKSTDKWFDWRTTPCHCGCGKKVIQSVEERRRLLKEQIDIAMGLRIPTEPPRDTIEHDAWEAAYGGPEWLA